MRTIFQAVNVTDIYVGHVRHVVNRHKRRDADVEANSLLPPNALSQPIVVDTEHELSNAPEDGTSFNSDTLQVVGTDKPVSLDSDVLQVVGVDGASVDSETTCLVPPTGNAQVPS